MTILAAISFLFCLFAVYLLGYADHEGEIS